MRIERSYEDFVWIGTAVDEQAIGLSDKSNNFHWICNNEKTLKQLEKKYRDRENIRFLLESVTNKKEKVELQVFNVPQFSSLSHPKNIFSVFPGLKVVSKKQIETAVATELIDSLGINEGARNGLLLDVNSQMREILADLKGSQRIRLFSEVFLQISDYQYFEEALHVEEAESILETMGFESVDIIENIPDFPVRRYKKSVFFEAIEEKNKENEKISAELSDYKKWLSSRKAEITDLRKSLTEAQGTIKQLERFKAEQKTDAVESEFDFKKTVNNSLAQLNDNVLMAYNKTMNGFNALGHHFNDLFDENKNALIQVAKLCSIFNLNGLLIDGLTKETELSFSLELYGFLRISNHDAIFELGSGISTCVIAQYMANKQQADNSISTSFFCFGIDERNLTDFDKSVNQDVCKNHVIFKKKRDFQGKLEESLIKPNRSSYCACVIYDTIENMIDSLPKALRKANESESIKSRESFSFHVLLKEGQPERSHIEEIKVVGYELDLELRSINLICPEMKSYGLIIASSAARLS